MSTSRRAIATADADDNVSGSEVEDIEAWRLGGEIGCGPVEFGAGYGDSGSSACVRATACDAGNNFRFGPGYDHEIGRVALS